MWAPKAFEAGHIYTENSIEEKYRQKIWCTEKQLDLEWGGCPSSHILLPPCKSSLRQQMKTVGVFHSLTMNSSPPAPKRWRPTGIGDVIFTNRGKLAPAACPLHAIYDLLKFY